MAEETVVAAPSAAAVEAPVFTQFDGWDEEGTPVVRSKPEGADSAAAKETTEEGSEAESGKGKQETRRKPDAEARIKELAARAKQLEKELEEARKPKETKSAESSTAKAAETKVMEPPPTRPKPKLDDKTPDGKAKYADYEEFRDDLTDWKVEQKLAAREREAQIKAQRESLESQFKQQRERYPDFDTVSLPLANELLKPDIAREVVAVVGDSPVMWDVLHVIGGSAQTKADFLEACRKNPGKALRVALLIEQEIVREASKGSAAAKTGEGQGEGEKAPATLKPRAPKPPTEVGGRGAPGEDALVSAAKSGDFRAFDAEQTRRALAARK